jgi:hypothetical protein
MCYGGGAFSNVVISDDGGGFARVLGGNYGIQKSGKVRGMAFDCNKGMGNSFLMESW